MLVFLSHNSRDKPAVEELARRLEAAGIHCWLDKWNLAPGDLWDEAIEKALGECEVCVVFLGPSGFGPWHNEEMRQAIRRRVSDSQRRFRIVPVILPGGRRVDESRLPLFLQGTTWQEFPESTDDDEAFRRLKCGILGQPPGHAPARAPLAGRCPYVGLRAFSAADAPLFFGRDAIVQQLIARLRDSFSLPQERRFLVLMGPSGSGKSSLVAAGLLPAIINDGALPGSTNWPCIQFRPGSDPWENLLVAVASHEKIGRHLAMLDALARTPEDESRRLHLLARVACHDQPETCRLLVFVDQFEEFFTQCQSGTNPDDRLAAARQLFLDNLLYPSTVPDSRVVVVLALRADFYGYCASYPGLRAAVSENHFLIGPFTEAELHEAILRPAQLCGCEVEPALVDLILEGMRLQPGALPFLQHALFKLWEARDGHRLTTLAYRKMGGLDGALDTHAESYFGRLSADRQSLLRIILLNLVQLGEGVPDTKRRLPLAQLTSGNQGALAAFVSELVSERVRLLITDESDGVVHVELTHEALIRGWGRLKGWIDESRAQMREKDRVERGAQHWQENGCSEDYLWRGAQLSSAEFTFSKSYLTLSEAAVRFLNECRCLRERQEQAERVRQTHELETQKRLREAEAARAAEAEARSRAERERALAAESLSKAYHTLGHNLRNPVAMMQRGAGKLRYFLRKDGQGMQAAYPEIYQAFQDHLQSLRHGASFMDAEFSKLSVLYSADEILRSGRMERSDLRRILSVLRDDFSWRTGTKLSGTRRIAWRFEVPAQSCWICGREDLVDMAVRCVIDNAFKYSYPGRTISVSLCDGQETVTVIVENTGIPISAEDVEHLWERGFRGRGVERRNLKAEEGAGLGLFLVRRLLAALGGNMTLDSRALGDSPHQEALVTARIVLQKARE